MSELAQNSDAHDPGANYRAHLIGEDVITPEQWKVAIQHPRLHEIVTLAVDRTVGINPTELEFDEFREVKEILHDIGVPANSIGKMVYDIYEDVKSKRNVEKVVG